jgi:hypothetical protein
VRTRAVNTLALVLLATVGVLSALALAPADRTLAVRAYVLALGALGLVLLVGATARAVRGPAHPSPFELSLRTRRRSERPPHDLAFIALQSLFATENAFDVHYRLRPLLREIAASRLGVRRGIDLDANPGAARAALGDEAWELVRPDREPPEDHFARGLSLPQLERVVESLEAI